MKKIGTLQTFLSFLRGSVFLWFIFYPALRIQRSMKYCDCGEGTKKERPSDCAVTEWSM